MSACGAAIKQEESKIGEASANLRFCRPTSGRYFTE
jgi:hypothetical protein